MLLATAMLIAKALSGATEPGQPVSALPTDEWEDPAMTRPRALCEPAKPNEVKDATGKKLGGMVLASYVVHKDGNATWLKALNRDAPVLLVSEVKRWLEQCRFEPARLGESPHAVRMTQVFRFHGE
jgi:hypothetical protein